MKKIVVSVGLVALGAAGLQTATAQNLDIPRPEKPFSLGATLRGFYDDNPNTLSNSNPDKRDSFGVEVSPTASLALTRETTTISLSYLFSAKYYENKPINSSDHYDLTHTFNALLDHQFNEQYKIGVKDSFVIGQEPDLLRAGNTMATPFRVSGDNIRNFGGIVLDGNVTRQIGFEVGYDNTFYKYSDTTQTFQPATGPGLVQPSTGGLLNDDENAVHLDGRWTFTPDTVGLVGFRFRDVDYTQDQLIGGGRRVTGGPVTNAVTSSDRNFRTYTPYVGAEHTFLPDLTGSVRVGANYADYYNDPSSDSGWSPYAMVSLRYRYAPESYVEVGFQNDRSSTDVSGFQVVNGHFTVDAESSTLFGAINHRIMPKLYGSLTGQFQNSSFNGGSANNETDQYYLVGLNLEYRFTQNFSADVGYNYDKLTSDIPGRNYDRNRVYMGVTASY